MGIKPNISSVGFLICLISGFAFGQTTEPTSQPDYPKQEAVLAAKIKVDNDRLIATTAAQTAAQKTIDADNAELRDILYDDICATDADIAVERVTLFLQDPTEGGTRTWSRPGDFPPPKTALTVWCGSDVDIVSVRDFWFIIDGQGTVHVSAFEPKSVELSKATAWDFQPVASIHVDVPDVIERINGLHKKLRLAAATYPQHTDDFYSCTILFQRERVNYAPTIWDDLHQDYIGGYTVETTGPSTAENGSYYGEISTVNGLPRTHYVNGYYRADGTYVRSYYRSR